MDFSIGLSGLRAATRSMDEAALRIARAGATGAAQPPADAPPAAPQGAAQALPAVTGPTAVDLPRAMVDLAVASNAVLANLQTIRRTDETLRALLEDR
jgi:hypothetical protein